MKAPERLFVEVCEDGIFAFPEPPFEESVEYIRADLVEQAIQQEQQEVDLEKEIDAFWNPRFNFGWDEHSALSMNHAGFASIARHFYELGRKQVLQEIYDGKTKPVDKITAAWLDD